MYKHLEPWLDAFVKEILLMGFVRDKRWVIEELFEDPYQGKYVWISKETSKWGWEKGFVKSRQTEF